MKIRNMAGIVLVFALAGVSNTASATPYGATGTVYSIGAFSNIAGGWSDTITITVDSTLGPICGTSGQVQLRIQRNADGTNPAADRVFSIALTAFTLGKEVYVQVDDQYLLNSQCEIKVLRIGGT